MTTLRVLIDTDNDAFTGADGEESPVGAALQTAEILRRYARLIEQEGRLIDGHALLDTNGNVVGRTALLRR